MEYSLYLAKEEIGPSKNYVKMLVKWNPPFVGAYKLNKDSACNRAIGKARLGEIIRDHDGNWAPHMSSIQAELLALKRGL